MVTRISGDEFRELDTNIQNQQQNLQEVMQQGDSVVGSATYSGAAADDFRQHWQQDRGRLEELSQELEQWRTKLRENADVADDINQPYNID